jgi:hypothetical protein
MESAREQILEKAEEHQQVDERQEKRREADHRQHQPRRQKKKAKNESNKTKVPVMMKMETAVTVEQQNVLEEEDTALEQQVRDYVC